MTGPRQGLFIVFEGIDGSGKTFHMDAVKEALIARGPAIHSVVFPNSRTPLGRFLKECLQKGQPFAAWTYHVVFAIHRWEFMEWITTVLTHNEIVLCERYTWSGVVYSSTLDPTLDLQGFMSVENGIIAPDLVVYIDTPPSRVVGKHAISSLFDERAPCVTSTSQTWKYLWDDTGNCAVCLAPYGPNDEVQGCYGCFATVHHHCLMQDWRAERFPVCCACGEVAPEPPTGRRAFFRR